VSEPLKIGVRDNIKKQIAFDRDKPVYRVINDFLFIQQSERMA
jgi:hypothetical protein